MSNTKKVRVGSGLNKLVNDFTSNSEISENDRNSMKSFLCTNSFNQKEINEKKSNIKTMGKSKNGR
jgi:hypothetical protein